MPTVSCIHFDIVSSLEVSGSLSRNVNDGQRLRGGVGGSSVRFLYASQFERELRWVWGGLEETVRRFRGEAADTTCLKPNRNGSSSLEVVKQ